MNAEKKQTGSELLIKISGNIDSNTAPNLNTFINESLEGIESLILDFEKVDYISSAGLRVLLSIFKGLAAKGGTMIVRKPNQDVMDIFVMTGFDTILNIEK